MGEEVFRRRYGERRRRFARPSSDATPPAPPVLFAAANPTSRCRNATLSMRVPSRTSASTSTSAAVRVDAEGRHRQDVGQVKGKVEKRGKTRTVVKNLKKYVTHDFAWKDPIAAQKAGMSLKDYVIGGMDRTSKGSVSCASRDGRGRASAWHNERIPR